ncbi:MAG TPA: hypothetical protein DIC22_10925 [Chitinophagaceae bacterium]|nr:hypothetical protein [Chitinophagaceae bacterium]
MKETQWEIGYDSTSSGIIDITKIKNRFQKCKGLVKYFFSRFWKNSLLSYELWVKNLLWANCFVWQICFQQIIHNVNLSSKSETRNP